VIVQVLYRSASAGIITGILLFCILGSEFFISYKVSFRRKRGASCPVGRADT